MSSRTFGLDEPAEFDDDQARRFDYDDAGQLELRIGSGTVRLTPRDRPGISGSVAGPRIDQATINQAGDSLIVVTPRHPSSSYEFAAEVAPGTALQLGTGSADVVVEVELGSSQIRTGSGDVRLTTVEDLDYASGSGDLHVELLDGRQARISTGSGDVSIRHCEVGLRVKAASGDVTIDQLAGELRGNCASGSLLVKQATAGVDWRSASGDVIVRVAEDLLAWLDLSSATGDVSVGLGEADEPDQPEPFIRIRSTTASGDITVERAK